MELKECEYDVGVIIGRFQVADLHEAHINLIKTVTSRHSKVILFLGIAAVFDNKDPLDFETRKKMIEKVFPSLIITHIHDQPNNRSWSSILDEKIKELLTPRQSCVLYGGRDSFIEKYTGSFPTQELVQEHWVSGSKIRGELKNKVDSTTAFRHGAIWSQWNRYPTVYPTVDVCLYKKENNSILLGKKNRDGGLWRFPGGFVDGKDSSYEEAAHRELSEEVLDCTFKDITIQSYLGSFKIPDWRYRGREDCIMTLFYMTEYIEGTCQAGDDLDETKWFKINEINESMLVPFHTQLLSVVKNKLNNS